MRDSVWIGLMYLGVYCNPEHFTFKSYGFLSVLLWVKPDLVVNKHNPLILQEVSDLVISFAIWSILTPLKLDVKQACLWRVEVAEEIQVILIAALQLFVVKIYYFITL